MRSHDEAILLFRCLLGQVNQDDLSEHLASTLTNKGNALQISGQPSEALVCYAEAIALFRRRFALPFCADGLRFEHPAFESHRHAKPSEPWPTG